jgi:hypothetical protein
VDVLPGEKDKREKGLSLNESGKAAVRTTERDNSNRQQSTPLMYKHSRADLQKPDMSWAKASRSATLENLPHDTRPKTIGYELPSRAEPARSGASQYVQMPLAHAYV